MDQRFIEDTVNRWLEEGNTSKMEMITGFNEEEVYNPDLTNELIRMFGTVEQQLNLPSPFIHSRFTRSKVSHGDGSWSWQAIGEDGLTVVSPVRHA